MVKRAWGGPAGLVRAADEAEREQLRRHPVPLRRVLMLFAPYRGRLLAVMAVIVASSLVGVVQPFLVREVVDVAIPLQRVPLLLVLVGGMVAATVVTQLLGVLQTLWATMVGQRVMHDLRVAVFENLQRQSLAFFTRTRTGEAQSRLVNDVGGMQSVVTNTATSIAANATTTIATVVAMVALSWRLSLLSLLVVPPAVWITRKVALARRALVDRRQETMADLHTQIEEGLSLSGMRLIRTLGASRARSELFGVTSGALVDLEVRSQLAGRWRLAVMQIVFAVIPALVYLVAGLPATSGGMTIGTLIAFTGLQAGLFRPLMSILNVSAEWISSMALFGRIFAYVDVESDVPEPVSPVFVDPVAARGEVCLEGVSLRYPGSDRDAVSGVDLFIPAGGTVALVGATGSGKSTVASLVRRLVDPSQGRVMIDGVDVRDIAEENLAALVGIVLQETYLVHDSIRANLLLARPDASEGELWAALEVAQIADVVRGLPLGLDTVVGARGYRFSGGEQQRIAVARTVLRDPRVLVLDEATSALDNTTERELQVALDGMMAGRTTLVIAHRLSTIRDADVIVVLDAGRVVERGSHAELMALGGAYAALVAGDGGGAVG
ncbi:ABC transporter ATP-binding protein [Dermatophilus congolensis]|nr:ABC transporter ATP-binding protein [Dermatophilus congolensis]